MTHSLPITKSVNHNRDLSHRQKIDFVSYDPNVAAWATAPSKPTWGLRMT